MNFGVGVSVEGAIVSTGKVLRGVGTVGVAVGVSVGVGVLVRVGVFRIADAVSAAAVSAFLVAVGVMVNVAVGVIYFWCSVASTAAVTRAMAAFSATAVS